MSTEVSAMRMEIGRLQALLHVNLCNDAEMAAPSSNDKNKSSQFINKVQFVCNQDMTTNKKWM